MSRTATCAAALAVAATLTATLLAPPAQAAAAHLTAERIDLGADAALGGLLRVVDLFGRDPVVSSLEIQAGHLRLELDARWANGTVAGDDPDAQQSTTTHEYADGTFVASAARPNHSVFLAGVQGLPDPAAAWEGPPGALLASRRGSVEQLERPPQNHAERAIDVRGTVEWAPQKGTATLSLAGTFYLALWEVDGTAADAERSRDYTTGERTEGGVLPMPLNTGGQVVDRLLHVTATDARLTWTFATADLLAFHATDASAQAPGAMRLSQPRGSLADGPALDGTVLAVTDGRLEGIQAAGPRLALRAEAGRDGFRLDGQAVHIPPAEASSRGPAFAAAATGLALLAGAWRWSRGGVRRMERAMEAGRYERALALRPRRLRPAARRRANVLHAVSLLALGQPRQAAAWLEGLPGADLPEPATWAYLMAAARAGEGRVAEAKALVEQCLALDAGYLAQVLGNPSLLVLLVEGRQ